jgi:hypothetical protein
MIVGEEANMQAVTTTGHDVAYWHISEVPLSAINARYRG